MEEELLFTPHRLVKDNIIHEEIAEPQIEELKQSEILSAIELIPLQNA